MRKKLGFICGDGRIFKSFKRACAHAEKVFRESGAVFENKLMEAFERADDTNSAAMLSYAVLLFVAPVICYGSPEKVSKYIANGGIVGALTKEKEAVKS